MLDDLEHQWMAELRRIAPESPTGQKRIMAINSPHVFRLRVSDERGATWLDKGSEVVWLCAVERREDGSGDDAFAYFEGLHAREQLLPSEDDYLRLRAEAAILQHRLSTAALLAIVDLALSNPGEEFSTSLLDEMPCRVVSHESEGMQEIWCGLSVRAVDGSFLNEKRRDLLFAELEQHLAPAEAEARTDWDGDDPIPWFEAVRLVVRFA
jgi:hypothetical protein